MKNLSPCLILLKLHATYYESILLKYGDVRLLSSSNNTIPSSSKIVIGSLNGPLCDFTYFSYFFNKFLC